MKENQKVILVLNDDGNDDNDNNEDSNVGND